MPSRIHLIILSLLTAAPIVTGFTSTPQTISYHNPFQIHQQLYSRKSLNIDDFKLQPKPTDGLGPLDFGVTDSLCVPDDVRPSLLQTVSNPRDGMAILLLLAGCSVAFHNICGIYGPSYELSQQASVALGVGNVLAVILQLKTSFLIAKRCRMGVVDDSALTTYAGLYSAAAVWLALRTSTFCPPWLINTDSFMPWITAGIFGYSLMAPAVTLYEHYNSQNDALLSTLIVRFSRSITRQSKDEMTIPTTLSETEVFRTNGLLFIGALGCVFVPACLAFAIKGNSWWQTVIVNHPKQNLLESTDALFALFATEASMICTRAANGGVAPYRKAVPIFAMVCLILALIPCGCSLIWLGGGDDISFFSFYSE